jgi:hypothetical protein
LLPKVCGDKKRNALPVVSEGFFHTAAYEWALRTAKVEQMIKFIVLIYPAGGLRSD